MSFNSNGGTNLKGQFNLKNTDPIDGRYVITSLAEYNALTAKDGETPKFLYPGLTFTVTKDLNETIKAGNYTVDSDGKTINKNDFTNKSKDATVEFTYGGKTFSHTIKGAITGSIDEAAKVTGKIGDADITSIFETDGTTVKKASEAAKVTNSLTFSTDGKGDTDSFNGSAAKTISYNSIGAAKAHDHPYLANTTTYAGSSTKGGSATSAEKVNNKLTITVNNTSTEFDGSSAQTVAIATTDADVTLSETVWTDKTIGYINGTTTSPKIVGNKGDTLKQVLTNIFGTVEDDSANLVTNPYFSHVSIGASSYEYGTILSSLPVTITPAAGSYKYGPDVSGAGWSGNYTLSGTGFTTKNDSPKDTQTVTLSNDFTVGTSSALTLTVTRAYTAATNTANTKMGNATTQKIKAGTATKNSTFNPTAVKYVYYATTSNTTTPTTWTLYDPDQNGVGQTGVTDLTISADAGKYVWVATTSNCSSFYTFNEVSGKYNTDKTPTTKISNQAITNSQGAKPTGYHIYRTTNAKALSGSVKYKLA